MNAPIVILVAPQLGENIGMVARVLQNFEGNSLRLVRPRDLWPNPLAIQAAAGAYDVLNTTQIYDSVEEAIQDLQFVFAATVRSRYLEKPVYSSRAFPHKVPGEKWGILFGPENAGLCNEDISKANAIITIPTCAEFGSLNLSHAVGICLYEWHQSRLSSDFSRPPLSPIASKKEVTLFLNHLESSLEKAGFFLPTHKRKKMVWNLRSIFQRIDLTEQEVQTLRGVIKALSLMPPP